MRRSAVWPVLLCLTVLGHVPVFATESLEAPEIVGFELTIGGVEAVDAVTGAFLSAAVADIVAEQGLIGNLVEDHNPGLRSRIEGSGNDNSGIVNVNQNTGSLNNQANVRALALVGGAPQVAAIVHLLDVWASTAAIDNTAISSGASRENVIASSFDRTVGFTGVNQAAGSLNQQANLLAFTFGGISAPGELAALQDATLGEVSVGNTVEDNVAVRSDTVSDSFREYRGAVQAAQISGDLNVVRNVLTISVTWISDSLALSASVPSTISTR